MVIMMLGDVHLPPYYGDPLKDKIYRKRVYNFYTYGKYSSSRIIGVDLNKIKHPEWMLRRIKEIKHYGNNG